MAVTHAHLAGIRIAPNRVPVPDPVPFRIRFLVLTLVLCLAVAHARVAVRSADKTKTVDQSQEAIITSHPVKKTRRTTTVAADLMIEVARLPAITVESGHTIGRSGGKTMAGVHLIPTGTLCSVRSSAMSMC